MKQAKDGVCPVCGAAVQENARFCLHCMTSFDEKNEIPAAGRKKQSALLWVVLAVGVLFLLAALFLILLRNREAPVPQDGAAQTQATGETQASGSERAPLIEFETFRPAVIVTSEQLGCDDFWDVDGFLDVEYNKETHTQRYTTPLNLSGARLDLFFRNGGDVITLILSDVPEDRLDDGKQLCAAVHAAVTNHYSDILNILTDDGTYHRFDAGTPYEEFFTDMTGRTAAYAKALADGTEISTRYTLIDDENKTDDDFTVFFETKRETGDADLYDLILRFDYYSNEEVRLGGED